MTTDVDTRQAPADAQQSAWFRYRAIAKKQDREIDRRSYEDGWRDGARYTFAATSKLSPLLDSFMRWVEYVTDWEAPPPADVDQVGE